MATQIRGNSRVLFTLLVLTVIFLSPQFAAGATTPDVTRLLTIPGQTFSTRVASDAAGNVYIADTLNKKVRIYSFTGELKKSIGLSYSPTALAVSPDNLLYVGENAQNGHCYVEVFSASGALVRTMNVTGPIAMAFLSTGELYLVDGYKVKKFDAAMNQVMEFGGYTMFRYPSALALSEQKGEIYVLDRGGSATEGSYTNTPVWRVQVFNLSGSPLRSFSSYGFGADGKIGSSSGVAVDKDGRIYISDNVQPIIGVFDENGVYLNTIYDAASPIYNPVNISYNNDRLYIASLAGKFVTAYGIGQYAGLGVTPTTVDITWQAGMAAPSKPVTVSNTGTGTLTWTATVDAAVSSWLGLSPASGTIAANSGQDAAVTVNTSGLTAGQKYSGTINITSNGGSLPVTVNVTVADPPVLTVSPASINIQRKSNEKTPPVTMSITIGGDISGGTLTWHAAVTSDGGWLGMLPLEGTSALITAPVATIADAVQPGSYNGSIIVTLDGAVGSPVTVPVKLQVVSSSGIAVRTNNADASFTISGPNGASFSGTGINYTTEGVAPGAYTITYNSVKGFKTPASESKTIEAGQDAAFTGNYTDLRDNMNIVASHGFRKGESNEVAVYKGDGTLGLTFTPSLPYAYGVSTAVADVDGDGVKDILVGGAPSIVRGYHRDGSAIAGLKFSAYDTSRRSSAGGVNLAAADFDGDGRDEIITGDAKYSSVVRVFTYASAVEDSGVYVEPFKDLGEGVNVAAADIDGDGKPELIALQAVSDLVPEVKVYKVNTSGGAGHWVAVLSSRFMACETAAETNLAAADVNGDGVADIVVLCTVSGSSQVREFSGTGELIASFATGNAGSLASGDTNFDGTSEIVLGDPPLLGNRTFRILDPKGSVINTIAPFTKKSNGVRVSVGNLGY